MAETVRKNLGMVTAYAYAVSKGYSGTEEEFAELMASYADVAQDAEASAQAAAQSATTAEQKATQAAGSATSAAESANDAEASAQMAAGSSNSASLYAQNASASATNAAGSASSASTHAGNASASAQAAEGSANDAQASATQAAGSATTATTKAGEAATSATTAVEAAQRAEDAATTLVIDDTLTHAGQAADAKETGDEIGKLKENLTEISGRIDDIEEAEGLKRYGVSGIGNAATTLTRILDSVGMVAQVGTDGDNSEVVNDFDDAVPFNRRKCVGDWELKNGKPVFKVNAYLGDEDYSEDGSMGEYVAVECPRAYYSMNGGTLIISAHKYPGFRPFDIFCHDHDASDTMPCYYKNAYSLALKDGKAVSLPGYDNEQGSYAELMEAVRTYKDGALGNSVILMPAAWNFYEWALFTVEFATTNCQSVMQGCAGLRHNANDMVDFIDATKAITNNYYATRISGEYIAITPANIDINDKRYQATHKITAITRCDENGVPDESGTHQLLELEDLGKGYWEYDSATSYRIAARPYRTGACNGVSTPSGSPVSNHDSYHPCKYRWHENPFGNQFKTAVDLFDVRVGTSDDDWTLDWYLLLDPAGFATKNPAIADLETEDFIKLDVGTEHENYKNGYIKSKKHSKAYPDIWIPNETVGASATTYFGDYAYLVYSYLVRSVRFGGHWYNGAYDGFSSANAYIAPSNGPAASGGDLCVAQ